MRFWYLSYCQALKAQASLWICTGEPKPSMPHRVLLLAYTTIDVDKDSIQNSNHLPTVKEAFAISTKISCAGPYIYYAQ